MIGTRLSDGGAGPKPAPTSAAAVPTPAAEPDADAALVAAPAPAPTPAPAPKLTPAAADAADGAAAIKPPAKPAATAQAAPVRARGSLDPMPATAAQPAAAPPVAGGEAANPRTSTPPAATTAAALDEQVPATERAALKEGQAAALRAAEDARRFARGLGDDPTASYREVLGSYYEQHPVHVEAEGDTAFAASYDKASGTLKLQRNHVASATQPPAAVSHVTAPAAADVVSDTTITVDARGERTTAVRTAPQKPSAGRDYLETTTTTFDATGKQLARREQLDVTSSDGTSTRSTSEATFGTGALLVSEHRTWEASSGGANWKQEATTEFDGSRRTRTIIDRSLDTGRQRDVRMPLLGIKLGVERAAGTSRYELSYDADGRLDRVTGTDPIDGRDPLDRLSIEHLGVPTGDDRRPAFGPVELAGDEQQVNGRSYHAPGNVAGPGVLATVSGRPVFVESGTKRWGRDVEGELTRLEQALDRAPDLLAAGSERFDLLEGRSPGDAYRSALYGEAFHAGATAVGKGITFWNGKPLAEGLLYHELAHGSYDTAKGAPSDDAWRGAMLADQRRGVPASVPKGVHILIDVAPQLEDKIGATAYAERAFGDGRNMGEDWADSTAMYLLARHAGGIVEVRDATGALTTRQFEDLYPNRAKLLDAYYKVSEQTSQAVPETQVAPSSVPATAAAPAMAAPRTPADGRGPA